VDAAYFLEEYIKKYYEPVKLTRTAIAEALGIDDDFVFIDR
jgi:hypothetical protein